ncbi:MAG: hypothetical protein MJ236_04745 [Clostridia bacterium]|nr:hypothetical protein [Clostridia bacterium]
MRRVVLKKNNPEYFGEIVAAVEGWLKRHPEKELKKKYKETIKWHTIKLRTMTYDEIEDLARLLHCAVEVIDN